MRPWLESLFVSLLPFSSTPSFLTLHNRLACMRSHYICSSLWRRIQLCYQHCAFCIYIPPAMITHPLTGFLSPLRHQRRYFLWHYLPLTMAI